MSDNKAPLVQRLIYVGSAACEPECCGRCLECPMEVVNEAVAEMARLRKNIEGILAECEMSLDPARKVESQRFYLANIHAQAASALGRQVRTSHD